MIQSAPFFLTGHLRSIRRVVEPVRCGEVSMPGGEFSASGEESSKGDYRDTSVGKRYSHCSKC